MSKLHQCHPQSRTCVSDGRSIGAMWQCLVHLAKAAQVKRGGPKGYPSVVEAPDVKTPVLACSKCTKPVKDHPLSTEWLNEEGLPWLFATCTGHFVRFK